MAKDIAKLIEENQKLVRLVAYRSFSGMARDDDLLQCGLIGLWRAAEAWDETRQFKPFACHCIRNAMRNYIRGRAKITKAEVPLEEWDEGEAAPDDVALDDLLQLFPWDTVEAKVIRLLGSGYQRQEIAGILHCDRRTVARACDRIKEKIEKQQEGPI